MNFLVNLFSSSYEELWKAIIRPFRDQYTEKDLGPKRFRINQKYYKRSDFSIINNRNIKLMCSFWEPFDEERECTYLPCVIYLHGNSSSRCEVVPNLKYLLPLNITVFAFDFAGCGYSGGEYISLGWYETLDVKCVIDFLRNSNKVSTIGLWGRSMGAVTSIMYACKDHTISGIFLDSPFYSLNLLIDELSKNKVSLPNFLVRQVVKMLKETVKEKGEFNIDDIEPVEYAKKCFVPSFFCHGKDDTFVNVHHCQDLYLIYPGEKGILLIEGDHNALRPDKLNEKASEFFYNALKCKYIRELNDSYFGYKMIFRDWNDPNFRTPKGDNENSRKFKCKNMSCKKISPKITFNKNDNTEEKKLNQNHYNINEDLDKKILNKKIYKCRNYEKLENNKNKIYNKTNDNIDNISHNKINGNNKKMKYHYPNSSKQLYNFKTFNRTKKEGQQKPPIYNMANSKNYQTQKNIKLDKDCGKNEINTENINSRNNQIYNNSIYKINNDNYKTIYSNNINNSNFKYDCNIMKENEQMKNIPIKHNKMVRHYISPKQSFRLQYPLSNVINLNHSENTVNFSPKNIKSISPTYIVDMNKNSQKKNNNYIPFNNNDKIYTSNIYYNNVQTNKDYYNNNYNIYNNPVNLSINQNY